MDGKKLEKKIQGSKRTKGSYLSSFPSVEKGDMKNSKMVSSNSQTNKGQKTVLSLTASPLGPPKEELSINESRFNSGHFSKASLILRHLRKPYLRLERPRFWCDGERIMTYELLVSVLKYEGFLVDALENSYFYSRYPERRMPEEGGEEAVMVILYDLLERGFRVSGVDAELTDHFGNIQKAVLAYRTKLMAHMARLRIKYEANSIDHLLPPNLRHQHHIDQNPLYAWINLKKISRNDVMSILRRNGLRRTEYEDDILIREKLFCVDQHHPDLLRFHSSQSEKILNLPLTEDGKLVVQDKSACIYVYALVKALFFKETRRRNNALNKMNPRVTPESGKNPTTSESSPSEEWFDGILDSSGKHYVKPDFVVVTHCGSGRSAAHLACLLVEAFPRHMVKSSDMSNERDLFKAIQSKFTTRTPLTITAFGVPENKKEEVTHAFRKHFNLTNFRLYSEEFTDVPNRDVRVMGAAAILVNPPSSGSALKDPVAYVCSEGGDENVLSQLSKFISSTVISKEGYRRYTLEQVNSVKHALTFPDVKLIMYTTCSTLRCENSDVIENCLTEARMKEEARQFRLLTDIIALKPARTFRTVTYEIVNLEEVMEGYPDTHFNNNLIEIPPSSASSGVFVALIRRRDRIMNLGRNPLQTFISTQLAFQNDRSELGASKSTGSIPVSPTVSDDSFPEGLETEEQWARYIAEKYDVDIDAADMEIYEDDEGSSSYTGSSSTLRLSKRKLSKKAIVKRLSIPTYASLAKKKDKWVTQGSPPPTCNVGQRPRSKPSSHGSSGRKPFGNNASADIASSRGLSADPCICTRHAKNFPEFTKVTVSQPKLVTVTPDATKASHDVSKASHDAAKVNYDAVKVNHDVSKASHDVSKASHDVSKVNHDAAKVNHDAAKVSPKLTKVRPKVTKTSPKVANDSSKVSARKGS